jgi:AbrB family looped-hinge helix DNA binding protein
MPVSKITSKFQTTVPKDVREKLSIRAEDSLEWTVIDGKAIVRPATSRLYRWIGYAKVGPGSAVADVRKARTMRGKK